MPIAKPGIIEHNVNVHQISWEILIPDVIPNVQDMMNAQLHKYFFVFQKKELQKIILNNFQIFLPIIYFETYICFFLLRLA